MGGFEGTAAEHVYKRWLAFGLLSTHSRLHGSGSYRVPWLFGDEAVEVCRAFSKLKMRLMPYLYAAACEAHEDGVPAMRAMTLEFPGDLACEDLDRQYMLGDAVLVAPVMREDCMGEYYLPDGTWTHLLSGETREGGKWRREKYDFFSLPLFVRENTLLPIGSRDDVADYAHEENVILQVYALKGVSERCVRTSNGEKAFMVRAANTDGKVRIDIEGFAKGLRLQLVNVYEIKNMKGASIQENERGMILNPEGNHIEYEL